MRTTVTLRGAVAGLLFAGAVLATSSYSASADAPSGIEIASTVEVEAKEYVEAHPNEMQTMASLCGTSYDVIIAGLRLPTDTNRLGTLWIYSNTPTPSSDSQNTCALFDNNTSSAKWMKLELCDNYVDTPCDVDQGTFSQYAGPVWQEPGGCGKVTALMKSSSSATTYMINRVMTNITTCN